MMYKLRASPERRQVQAADGQSLGQIAKGNEQIAAGVERISGTHNYELT